MTFTFFSVRKLSLPSSLRNERLFFLPTPPHLTQTWILWSNEWFYKVNYEDQICFLWPNQSACQFSWQSDKVNSNLKLKNLQVGGGGRKKSQMNWTLKKIKIQPIKIQTAKNQCWAWTSFKTFPEKKKQKIITTYKRVWTTLIDS